MNLIDWKLEALEIEEFGELIRGPMVHDYIALPPDPGLSSGQVCFKGLMSNGPDKRTFAMRLDKGITMETFFNAMEALRKSLAVSISQNKNVDASVLETG